MPELRLRGQRIRSGTHAVVDLTSAYAVESIATQTDQDSITPWVDPNWFSSTYPQSTRSTISLGFDQYEDGFRSLTWSFSFMTYDMFNYFQNLAGAVTIMDFDQANDAVYLTAVLLKARIGDFENHPYGFQKIRFNFVKGVVIT